MICRVKSPIGTLRVSKDSVDRCPRGDSGEDI